MKLLVALFICAVTFAGCDRGPSQAEIEAAKQAAHREAEREKKEKEFLTPSGNSQTKSQTTGRLSDK